METDIHICPELLQMTVEYVWVIALCTVFQIFATGLVPFIRNLGGATFAMACMMAGFFTNIMCSCRVLGKVWPAQHGIRSSDRP